jgi:hypothetical protein
MDEKQKVTLEASPEQILYARFLEKGMYIGLLILFITFGLYAFGIMDPYIPLGKISQYWTMNVDDYLHHANIKPGWAWVGMIKYGDFVNFIGIAMLSGVTILCYAAIVPTLARNKDTVYVVLAIIEIIVLTVAASGILGTGGH